MSKKNSSNKKSFLNLNIQELFFLSLLIGISLAFYKTLQTFLIPIFIAAILALLLKDPFNYLLNRFELKRQWAAAIIILSGLILITIPLTFVIFMISIEAAEGYNYFQLKWSEIQGAFLESKYLKELESIPYIQENISKLKELNIGEKIGEFLSSSLELLTKILRQAFLNTSTIILQIIIILYLVYFLLVDGQKLVQKMSNLIPLADKDEVDLVINVMNMAKGTLYGTVIIGVMEGIYGGLLFAICGIKSPFLWASIMTILSMIPLVGTNIVLAPVGFYFILTGDYLLGAIILILGSGGIIISQNIIRPNLIKGQSGIHPAIIVLSTLGGISWLGLVGFLIGPLLAALFVAIWDQFGERYKKELTIWNRNR